MSGNAWLPEVYLPRYTGYLLKNRFRQTIDDFAYFPCKTVCPSQDPFEFRRGILEGWQPEVSVRGKDGPVTVPLGSLLRSSGTTALLIVRNDELLMEWYAEGLDACSVSRYFSATKSVLSALVGAAVGEGMIRSVNQPVSDYLPELKTAGFDRMTLQNLLDMDSGVPFDEGLAPWSLQMRQYFSPDIRKDIRRLRVSGRVAETFHYNDWHPEILSLVLERAAGQPLDRFLEERVWMPIGAKNQALLVCDGEQNGFPKMDSGLVGTASDLARFGRLYLNGGALGGRQILPEDWVRASMQPARAEDSPLRYRRYESRPWGSWFRTGKASYQNMWWGYRTGENADDCFAMGVHGQILYLCPRKNMLLVRLGRVWGFKGWWPTVLKQLADECP